jgi:predicted DNA-binding transcriptional regulator YafY
MRCAPSFEVKTWVLGWGATATVLEPASLRQEIIAEVDATRANY